MLPDEAAGNPVRLTVAATTVVGLLLAKKTVRFPPPSLAAYTRTELFALVAATCDDPNFSARMGKT